MAAAAGSAWEAGNQSPEARFSTFSARKTDKRCGGRQLTEKHQRKVWRSFGLVKIEEHFLRRLVRTVRDARVVENDPLNKQDRKQNGR